MRACTQKLATWHAEKEHIYERYIYSSSSPLVLGVSKEADGAVDCVGFVRPGRRNQAHCDDQG